MGGMGTRSLAARAHGSSNMGTWRYAPLSSPLKKGVFRDRTAIGKDLRRRRKG